jgi:putative transposase
LHILYRVFGSTLETIDAFAAAVSATFKSRAGLQLENLALRHQLGVLQRSVKRPELAPADRLLWSWLCAVWSGWRSALVVVKPWGAPRIHGELLELGIDIGETSVGKYPVRHRKPPPRTWRTFLANRVKTIVSVDFSRADAHLRGVNAPCEFCPIQSATSGAPRSRTQRPARLMAA